MSGRRQTLVDSFLQLGLPHNKIFMEIESV